ncbi:type IV secretion system DNA-binding domain-containing protein [Nodosilinea nodulosa]|uniref:type IV secretion system DNA-binding domain-containing protein n=1 Tax=Nodosilinea nodulosa TaxID=416001 RepID=UPI00035E9979|nr:type IV secretion system DNA-binding domain-containing protein [Nodosilinea nodulosa]
MPKLIVWLLTAGWLYISTPRLYGLWVLWISKSLNNADLAMWNGGEWLSHACALMITALYIGGLCEVVHTGLLKGRTKAISEIEKVLLPFLLLLLSWWGTQLILRLLIQGVPASLSFLIAAFVTALVGSVVLTLPTPLPSPSGTIRGRSLREPAEFRRVWGRLNKRELRGLIPWGATFIAKKNEALHFILIGNTGAGKSTWLEVMMTKTLAGIGFNPNYRAIVVDAKSNLLPYLEALGLGIGEDGPLYVILNPLDKRAARWAIGKDINSPGKAREFARTFIPEVKGDNRFFTQTAVALLTAVIVSLQRAKGESWTLRDLINAFSNTAIAHALIQQWNPRPHDLDDYFKVKKGERNEIFMSVRAELDQFHLIAASWEVATREFSITDWIRGEYVLVLGSDYEYPDALKTINALLFSSIAARLKQLPDDPERRVWLYIDELIATGKLVAFEQLLQLGRSKSVCMVSSVLNMASFVEEFGENIAKSIWGLSRHKAMFPMDSDSAKYISDAIGKHEVIQTTYTPQVPNPDKPPSISGVSYQRTERTTILPQELDERELPVPGPKNGLSGYFSLPGEGIHYHTYSWQEITKMRPERLDDGDGGVVGYDRIDERFVRTIPTPWTEEELAQLKLSPPDAEGGDAPRSTKPHGPRKPGDNSGAKPPRPIKKKPKE